MIRVQRQKNETTDLMIRRFCNKCHKAGVINECLKRMSYRKPGDQRRIKHYAALKRAAKKNK